MALESPRLRRSLHTPQAMLLGLGAVVGTGAFLTLGMAVDLAGSGALLALGLALLVAMCNGQASAHLAALYPVSGGTYVYGYRFLHPWAGFAAGWLFLVAKSASAATAILGIATYLTGMGELDPVWRISLALAVLCVITLVVARGLQLSMWVSGLVIAASIGMLLLFSAVSLVASHAAGHVLSSDSIFTSPMDWPATMEAAALIFVAFTGYGRVATLGEEVVDPRHTIPRAVTGTLVVSGLVYLMVMLALLALQEPLGSSNGTAQARTLSEIACFQGLDWLARCLVLGATLAMTGVVLNLLLGLSRVILAMARQSDMPRVFADVDREKSSPTAAVVAAALLVGAMVATGDIRLTWTFSALTVLLYYGITNLAALASLHGRESGLRWLVWPGFTGCLVLSLFIPPDIWLLGAVILLTGLLWRLVMWKWVASSC